MIKDSLVNAAPLIEEFEGTGYKLDFEYGACQFEYKTQPTPMDNLLDLNVLFEGFIEHLDRAIKKVYGELEVFPVFLGGNPSSEILKAYHDNEGPGLITNKSRYNESAKWQSQIPDVEIEGQKFKALQVAEYSRISSSSSSTESCSCCTNVQSYVKFNSTCYCPWG